MTCCSVWIAQCSMTVPRHGPSKACAPLLKTAHKPLIKQLSSVIAAAGVWCPPDPALAPAQPPRYRPPARLLQHLLSASQAQQHMPCSDSRCAAGPPPLPFIGNLGSIFTQGFHRVWSEWGPRYGPVYKVLACIVCVHCMRGLSIIRVFLCKYDSVRTPPALPGVVGRIARCGCL
jgi:hypothetical protein